MFIPWENLPRQLSEKYRHSYSGNLSSPYQLYVASLCKRYPNLKLLSDFLQSTDNLDTGRLTCLDFFESGLVSENQHLDINEFSDSMQREDGRLQGQMLIVEDLTRDIVEKIGSSLEIDPAFFAYHLYESRSEVETLQRLPYLLPSTVQRKGFVCFKYLQAVSFNTGGGIPPGRLICKSNVRRKVALCTATGCVSGDKYTGVVLRKITVLKTAKRCGTWQCR